MATHVVEGFECTLGVSHDEDALICDTTNVVVARCRNVGRVASIVPGSIEDCFAFQVVNDGIEIPV